MLLSWAFPHIYYLAKLACLQANKILKRPVDSILRNMCLVRFGNWKSAFCRLFYWQRSSRLKWWQFRWINFSLVFKGEIVNSGSIKTQHFWYLSFKRVDSYLVDKLVVVGRYFIIFEFLLFFSEIVNPGLIQILYAFLLWLSALI